MPAKEKNLCAARVEVAHAYEVWEADGWTWYVLKKYQSPSQEAKNPYARWLCYVTSPLCPSGEQGDVYVQEITGQATRVR